MDGVEFGPFVGAVRLVHIVHGVVRYGVLPRVKPVQEGVDNAVGCFARLVHPVDGVLEKIGQRIGATPAQVIFSWLKSKEIVIVT